MADDERRAEIEAVAREICAYANSIEKRHAAVECRPAVFLKYEGWREEYDDEAEVVIAALDRVRDARGDDEAACRRCGSTTKRSDCPGSAWGSPCDMQVPWYPRGPRKGEDHETSDAVRGRPIRHLPVNGPDDRQPNAPDRGQLRDAATPASGRGRSSDETRSPQGEDHDT